MSTTKTYIANIDTKRRDWTLTVRITRMWEVKYNPTSEIADSLDMVLLDEQGSQIHALIKKDLIPHFKEVAKEGSVQNDNIIWFNSFTSMKFEPEGLVGIPMHKFSFQPFEHMVERNNRKDILIEIIGQLTGVENKINKTTTSEERRTIHITNERDIKVTATLWGEKANFITDAIWENEDGPQVIIITATKVSLFNGNYQLNSTSRTKVHINLDIPEVHAFRESITGGHPNKIEMIQVQQPETIEETMKKTGKTIKELQELYNGVEENQVNRKTINKHENHST
ncbi:Replication protein A 70 kDa DNA-binding subunit A [Bienertia sinuspersici]